MPEGTLLLLVDPWVQPFATQLAAQPVRAELNRTVKQMLQIRESQEGALCQRVDLGQVQDLIFNNVPWKGSEIRRK